MPIQNRFSIPDNVIGSYNYADIISGTGYISLYAGKTVSGANLSSVQYYNNDTTFTSGSTSSTSYTKVEDIDFDVVLLRPLELKGRVIINVTLNTSSTGGAGGGTGTAYAVAHLRKWDGTTETTLQTSGDGPVVGNETSTAALECNLTTAQRLKIGETLRITIEVWAKHSDGTPYACNYKIYHDPKERSASGVDTTALTIHLPVRIDL